MQAHDSSDQRPPESHPDRRRDDERCPNHDEDQLVHPQVPDGADRTVCLSATLAGEGGLK